MSWCYVFQSQFVHKDNIALFYCKQIEDFFGCYHEFNSNEFYSLGNNSKYMFSFTRKLAMGDKRTIKSTNLEIYNISPNA